MDDGNSDESSSKLSDNVLFPNQESCSNFQASKTCTHTHTCNTLDAIHTHTCYHTHTQLFDTNSMPKRASGNKEAVKKYREKKKAETAYLEEEVKKLRLVNQQLVRKLQGKQLLEAELLRLRKILAQVKGKIDSEKLPTLHPHE
ncbi:basic leucine zipper 23 [Cicer arietinum]|uniref:Basic leucine zipper 24 n=1 Tax=Cicer arietinum TaxID=3827 RepID=A0A1S2Y5R0_CICAR|nr:basic leucine zipper 24 [Cicer arietinum]XP_004499762.1 basic leucine zipper 24 [Cicer arietinum]XP_012571078.1 basic leucine zipper 24 [Cicer arietinum]XP_012571079.1 basic leucine zipper 24 [Cicer arietinum]